MAPDKPWKAPAFGSPMWIEIPAIDVQRSPVQLFCKAYTFYKKVFDWPFYGDKQPATYSKDEVMLFEFEDLRMSGGIVKLPREVGGVRGGRGGVCIWWLVENVDSIVKTIEDAGGKVVTDVLKEGSNGLYRYFEDPEGNVGAAYQFIGQRATAS